MRKPIITFLLLLTVVLPGRAQFYLPGDDPGALRWFSVETPHYQIVYPKGADSLARVYGTLLEQFRVPMGKSLGEIPGEGVRKKFPIILHTHNMYSNGSVGYAPRRMDLYTMPEAYGNEPVPWTIQLAAHEPRHQAQMQLAGKGFMKALPYIIGEGWNPIGWYLYFDSSLGEGDAVAAETGLASGTRAYTSDYLNYIQVSLDQGDYRTWERWYFSSYRHFTPDLYKISYMTVAAGRYLTDNPLFTKEIIQRSLHRFWPFSPTTVHRKIAEEAGKKKFKDAYPQMMDVFNDVWQASARERGPFLELEEVTPAWSFPINYSSPVWVEGTLYAVRSGYLHSPELVVVRDGKVKRLHGIGSHHSMLAYDAVRQRLYWSETRRDPRWSLGGSSVICFYDLRLGGTHTLTSGTRYYSPQLSADGSRMSVIDYHTDGSQAVVVLEPDNGAVVENFPVPSGVQFTEAAWCEDRLYALGVSQGGYGLWGLSEGGEWKEVLAPSVQKVVDLKPVDGALEWTSDRNGVNELYRYSPADDKLWQITSTRYGAREFWYGDGQLFCVSQTLDGKQLFQIPETRLQPKEVDYADVCAHPIEDKLKEQEASLGPQPDLTAPVEFTAPKRYSKLGHTSLHTWLPLYADYSTIMAGSFDLQYEEMSLGLSGFFQNTLSTFSGMLGYGFHPDPDQNGVWRSAFHARATYTGLLPVIEAKLDVGDRRAYQYYILRRFDRTNGYMNAYSALRSAPLVSGSLDVYIPWQFQRNGMLYGFTPQLRYSLTNSLFARGPVDFRTTSTDPSEVSAPLYNLAAVGAPDSVPMQRLSVAARGYWMRPRPVSAVYPRWGIGLEAAYSVRPGLADYFAPNAYAYAYAYVPGFARPQGLRLTGMVQKRLGQNEFRFGELAANTVPRGFASVAQVRVGQSKPFQWKVTADYAIPLYFGDLIIPRFLYIKKFLLSPHGDFTGLGGNDNLWSVGADFTATFNQLYIVTLPITMGVSVHYLGGTWYAQTGQASPWSVRMIFSIDI